MNGLLCYIANTSRPDIAFAVSQVARFNDCATAAAITAIVWITQYLNRTKDRGVVYGKDRSMTQPVTLADASHAWEPVKGWSTGGHVVMLYGGPVRWKSKSIKLIVQGTRDSEAMGVCAGVDSALWAREWMRSFGYLNENRPSIVYTDSSSLVAGLGDGSFNSSRRAIIQAGRMMRQVIKEGDIAAWHIGGKDNVSDILTKNEVPVTHERLTRMLVGEEKLELRSAGKFGRACAEDFL